MIPHDINTTRKSDNTQFEIILGDFNSNVGNTNEHRQRTKQSQIRIRCLK